MALDVELVSTLSVDELEHFLRSHLENTEYENRWTWPRAASPGLFYDEVLRDLGVDMKFGSYAVFRVDKWATQEEYGLLRSLRSKLREQSQAELILNGDHVME